MARTLLTNSEIDLSVKSGLLCVMFIQIARDLEAKTGINAGFRFFTDGSGSIDHPSLDQFAWMSVDHGIEMMQRHLGLR